MTDQEIIQARKDGTSINDLRLATGYGSNKLHKICKGVTKEGGGRKRGAKVKALKMTDEEIIDALKTTTIPQLAKRLGCGERKLRRAVKATGVKFDGRKNNRPPRITEEKREAIRRNRSQLKASNEAIAAKLSVSVNTVAELTRDIPIPDADEVDRSRATEIDRGTIQLLQVLANRYGDRYGFFHQSRPKAVTFEYVKEGKDYIKIIEPMKEAA